MGWTRTLGVARQEFDNGQYDVNENENGREKLSRVSEEVYHLLPTFYFVDPMIN